MYFLDTALNEANSFAFKIPEPTDKDEKKLWSALT